MIFLIESQAEHNLNQQTEQKTPGSEEEPKRKQHIWLQYLGCSLCLLAVELAGLFVFDSVCVWGGLASGWLDGDCPWPFGLDLLLLVAFGMLVCLLLVAPR